MFWAAQILGIVICVIAAFSYLFKQKKDYLMAQLGVNVLYGIQYALLGAFSGTVSNAVSLAKYIVFYQNEKKGKKNPNWQLFLFALLSVVLGLFALDGWFSVIPILTSVIFTYAIWQNNPVVLRVIVVGCNIMWIVFNIQAKAYVSAIYSVVELIFALSTMIMIIKERFSDDNKDNKCTSASEEQ